MPRRPDFDRSSEGFFTVAWMTRRLAEWQRLHPHALLPLRLLGFVLGVLLVGTGCRKTADAPPAPPTSTTATPPVAQPAPAWLEDATEELRLNFVHEEIGRAHV